MTQIGPYVECTTRKKIWTKSGNFYYTAEEDAVDYTDIDVKDVLVCANQCGLRNQKHYWFGNLKSQNFTSLNFHRRENCVYDFSKIDMTKECEAFCKQYQKEIIILEENYGKENIKVLWGVIVYAN